MDKKLRMAQFCLIQSRMMMNEQPYTSMCMSLRGLVQSPCGKINVIMTLGGEGVLVHDV